jgi:ribosomal protein S18 acetylase RimI-like enzyme
MSLRIATIGPGDEDALAALFDVIASDPTSEHFHPHPFTASEAHTRAHYVGQDLYALMTFSREVVGYGMLRGWDQGYSIPSLGIYIARPHRGTGASRVLMNYLQFAARLKGAKAVRLKVHEDNERAFRLYTALGYRFNDERENDQRVGVCELR